MCFLDPASLAVGGLQYGIGAFQTIQSNNQKRKDYRVATELTNDQVVQNYLSMAIRQNSEAEAANQRIQDISNQTKEAMGVARARAAQAGVSGKSVEAMLNEFERDQGVFTANELRSLQIQEANASVEAKSIYTRAQSSLFQARPAMTPLENPLGAALRIGLGAYAREQDKAMMRDITAPTVNNGDLTIHNVDRSGP